MIRFDHAVIVVPQLTSAMRLYRRQGFAVQAGGRHEGSPTRNALIRLADGGYLELLAAASPLLPHLLRLLAGIPLAERLFAGRSAVRRRFLGHLANGAGLADFCVITPSLEETLRQARAAGLDVEGPLTLGRTLPDGRRIEWLLGIPSTPDLPFLIEDLTPRELRVPLPVATDTPGNGEPGGSPLMVTHVVSVRVAVRDLTGSVERYRRLLDRRPLLRHEGVAVFELGDTLVRLIREDTGRGVGRTTGLVLAVPGTPPELLPEVAAAGLVFAPETGEPLVRDASERDAGREA